MIANSRYLRTALTFIFFYAHESRNPSRNPPGNKASGGGGGEGKGKGGCVGNFVTFGD